MKPLTIFIFGLINFAILVTALIWGTRRASSQFFYARRSEIKKDMVASAILLKQAKGRLLNLKKLMANLAGDILARHKTAIARATAEHDDIIKGARQKAAGLADAAARQSAEAKREALLDVRSRILKDAFARADAALAKGIPEKTKKDAVERGLKEVSAIMSSNAGAHGPRGGAL